MVARSREGKVTSYPVTETVHKSSICYVTQTPAQIPQELQDQARQIAEKTVGCLGGKSSASLPIEQLMQLLVCVEGFTSGSAILIQPNLAAWRSSLRKM